MLPSERSKIYRQNIVLFAPLRGKNHTRSLPRVHFPALVVTYGCFQKDNWLQVRKMKCLVTQRSLKGSGILAILKCRGRATRSTQELTLSTHRTDKSFNRHLFAGSGVKLRSCAGTTQENKKMTHDQCVFTQSFATKKYNGLTNILVTGLRAGGQVPSLQHEELTQEAVNLECDW